ncbi:DUF397 domain-containing protein [Plantactinospora sp. BB1]|uniref:DUF397 domain-containing protein n=1 Tax=Plantactinospora sp. BB1 TaxID=2071627 RepID=UPI000D15B7E2|nr:DUF397 domain-containing protein [Plantactinospora sp. BB1]AVT38491.1 DUF397 domain-containing protein [Plantactinospora sp. BB1]
MDVNTAPNWHKSSRSESGQCVEVADNLPGRVLVRDSKDRQGPVLTFGPRQWRGFVEGLSRFLEN